MPPPLPSPIHRWSAVSPARGAALWLAVLLGCAEPPPPAAEPPPPRHLLFVVVDTLRADAVGWAGYPRPTTPALDELAARSVVFEQAIAQSSWTRAAMASLVTGLWPTATGLTCHHFRTPESGCDVLRPDLVTLGEHFRRAGYRTAGVVANVNVDPVFGFDQGFGHYVSVAERLAAEDPDWRGGDAWLRATTEAVTEEALAWLAGVGGERPFLLYLHYLDPHEPYDPPPERRAEFPPEETPATDARAREPRSRYDAEVAHVDAELARVLAELEARELADETAVLVVSDHGEEFYEHGGTHHGWTMFDEQVRVPLLLHAPGLAPRRVATQVRQVDVLPTLLALFDLPPAEEIAGESLLPLLAEPGPDRVALSERGYTEVSSLRAPPWKLVHDHATGTSRLFHLGEDPEETEDRSADAPEVVAELLAELLALRAEAERDAARRGPHEVEVRLHEDAVERLRALGYGD